MSVLHRSIELLEPYDGKLSCTVLRGESTRKGADLPDPDLSTIAYNHLLRHLDGYKVRPKFYVINFDDPSRSHRCNPLNPKFMTDISDAYEFLQHHAQPQPYLGGQAGRLLRRVAHHPVRGHYLVPPHLQGRQVLHLPPCGRVPEQALRADFPHHVFLSRTGELPQPFPRRMARRGCRPAHGADCFGQDNEFSLDINNPDEPKVLCIGNNPDRQAIYGAALGLYNSRIVKLVNKKGRLKSSIIIDELPTVFIKGLDNLIATARSNKVAVLLGFQDFSQLIRDYTDKEAKVIINTVGNIFSGQVVGETAKTLSERFGKILQKRQSISINRNDVSTSISTQMDSLIPPSKISSLTQGMFVGSVADNFGEKIEQKIFHCEIVVDAKKVAEEERTYQKIPVITDFRDADGIDRMKEMVQENYNRIKEEARQIVADELERIGSDPNLKHLLELNKQA